MFNIEELKSLSEMQSQAVHCLWHGNSKKKIIAVGGRRTKSKNL